MAKRYETFFTDGFGDLRKLEIAVGHDYSMRYPGRHWFEEITGFSVMAIDGDEPNYSFDKDEILRIQSHLQKIGVL